MERPRCNQGLVSSTSEESSSKSEHDSYTIIKYDRLTVFQAAPLAYYDLDGNLWPIGMLDFELEREIVTDAVKEAQRVDAKIDVAFETATTDRLGAFLAKSESQILHFSCHGHPDYLFIENGWGAGQQLLVTDLKEWIAAGGSSLRFVFVSACHSRSAGEAFLAAGVPHVVCCQQDSQQVRNAAAVEFARAFYRALACGRSLREAFEFGKHGVNLCPHVEDAGNEVNKFALLPENADHDVPIFFTKPLPRTFAPKCWCPPRMFPVPPQPFVGRDVDMFRVIDAVRTARIVRVTGPAGAGKCSLVKAVGQYIYRRNLMDDMFWLPVDHKQKGDDIVSWLSRLYEEFQGESLSAKFRSDRNYRVCRDEILDELHEKKALIIIDARKIGFTGTNSIRKLTTFLEDLFQRTRNTKVIIVHRIGDEIRSRSFSCVEADVELAALDLESTVSLFASLCRFVGDYDELIDLLVAQHEANSPAIKHRSSEIFKMLGDGIPAKINDIAKTISPSDYAKLICIAKRPIPAAFKSRAALEQNLTKLGEEIEGATRLLDFRRAQEIQESLDEMEVLREALPDLATLRMMADGVRSDLEQAIFMKKFGTAVGLQTELDSLNKQIQLEIKDSPEPDPLDDGKLGGNDERKTPLFAGTRAGLEAAVRMLEKALEEACDNNDFRQARIIDGKLLHLKLRKEKLPSSNQLSMQIGQLKSELKEAKNERHWDSAETLHHKIINLEKKLALERDAEKEIRVAINDNEKQDNGRAKHSKVNEARHYGEADIGPRDPPGLYIPLDECEKKESAGNVQKDVSKSTSKNLEREEESGDGRATESVRPGAVAVGGSQSYVGGSSEEAERLHSPTAIGDVHNQSQELSLEEGDETQRSFDARRREFARQLKDVMSSLPTESHHAGAFHVQGSSAESMPAQDMESATIDSLDDQSPSSNRDAQERRHDQAPLEGIARLHSGTRPDDANNSASVPGVGPTGLPSTAQGKLNVDLAENSVGDTLFEESSRLGTQATLASTLEQKGRSLIIDGRILNPKQAEKYCKLKGLCRLCGEVQTHRRKRRGLLGKAEMEPITTTDANGEYTVYKGYCLRPFCYTLEQARREIGEAHKQLPSPASLMTSKRKKNRRRQRVDSNATAYNQDDEDLPIATAVAEDDEKQDSRAKSSATIVEGFAASTVGQEQEEEAERAKIEKMIQETIAKMTVTATKVEIESDDEASTENKRMAKGPRFLKPKGYGKKSEEE